MLQEMTRSRVNQIAAAFTLALAPVPANSLGNNDVYSTVGINTTLSANPAEFAFVPVEQATAFLIQETERLNMHLRLLKVEWENKQAPIELDKQSPLAQKHFLSEMHKRAELAKGFLAAARIAVQRDEVRKDDAVFAQVKKFARSASGLLYGIEDFLSFIEQTHPPVATTDVLSHLDAFDVKAAIRAEHKTLGLDIPSFDR
ncbi:hypothetical protein C5E22_11715 [Pectobacterium parmentieri]|uniref:hypothetical protein n=1 Tax=Pectobacterium TaxID=122277 RepID=UPI000EAB4ADB|nr:MULTISPECIES: hypothetical protein [Pectobacterium]AYH10185.1 hypothetical protein C5E24_11075 [Pectobacterium parmentieri]AYH19104.1 hypothetical protein C5E22_11715 [Pectobacterium parmentieri]AZS56610.1 hypothetical protein C5E18_11020 [Pectobacterium parmentieri]MBQ4779053.1 hypothetical protein [Pectobacterium versatile]MBQ4783453.1 hypothetical protein [Pectobacterium versatile]